MKFSCTDIASAMLMRAGSPTASAWDTAVRTVSDDSSNLATTRWAKANEMRLL
jgi:hypothetical protein